MNQRFNSNISTPGGHMGRFAAHAPSTRIAIISAGWHADIVGQSREACLAELQAHGLPPDRIECFEVPGAFEIPLHAQTLAASGRFDAILACGLVVDGGIYRHDFVATAVIDGLMRVQLDSGVPVFSAVLTPHHFHEHDEHRRYFSEHFVKKGRELAQACMQTLGARLALKDLLAA
ncbi:6,7-dimethyl-8-ribityllumazine synthase [Paucibacter sp. TC2R-5]|uniref:6,7-dimethyl-8-ribityllumazine synthase n=1 Tax=Paucibacter sp. TC2R-5 TaxID=2893555 RepID=UPI0039E184D3